MVELVRSGRSPEELAREFEPSSQAICDWVRQADLDERRWATDLIHHSDQGRQYTSIAFGARCREAGLQPSMGSVGDCYDNALAESFFAARKCELLERHSYRHPAEARLSVFDYLESFYNPRRRHSALGNVSPMRFETLHAARHPGDAPCGTARFRGTAGLLEPFEGSSPPPPTLPYDSKSSTVHRGKASPLNLSI